MKKAKKWYDTVEYEFFDPEIGQKIYRLTPCFWISQDEKDLIDARKDAAKSLAHYFELRGEKKMGPCACMGLVCHKFACSILWDQFLQSYSDHLLDFVKKLK